MGWNLIWANDMDCKKVKFSLLNILFNRLITLEDIYRTVKFLVIDNTGITSQSIKIDLGFTNLKKYN